jgi:hypothetical protein
MAKTTKRRATSSLNTHNASMEPNTILEINVEVESRTYNKAVIRGGKECYRCLTTVCSSWHSYGKLRLIMCNACVVMLDKTACGYCGNVGCREDDRILFHCRLCARGTHEHCENVRFNVWNVRNHLTARIFKKY